MCKKKILLVEDEDDPRIALTLMLRMAGFEVDTATYGGEMLVKMEGIDLILTDIRMPYLCGVDAANIAKHYMDAKMPIVAMTGCSPEDIPEDVFDYVIYKPISIVSLLTLLRGLT